MIIIATVLPFHFFLVYNEYIKMRGMNKMDELMEEFLKELKMLYPDEKSFVWTYIVRDGFYHFLFSPVGHVPTFYGNKLRSSTMYVAGIYARFFSYKGENMFQCTKNKYTYTGALESFFISFLMDRYNEKGLPPEISDYYKKNRIRSIVNRGAV